MYADFLLVNGNIHTLDAANPRVQAIAIHNGTIIATGSDDALRYLLKPSGQIIDLRGRTVLPGFTDAHIHFLTYGRSLQEIDLYEVSSIAEVQRRVAARAATTPAGQPLIGRGWNQSLWGSTDFPTRHDLDQVSTDHPIFLTRKCLHAGWANSRALEMAGITAATPDPPNGEIERDPATGEPTGILKEHAMSLMSRLISEPDDAAAISAIRAAMHQAHRHGITSIHNMEGARALRAYQDLHAAGELKVRVLQQIPEADMDAAIQMGIRTGLGDAFLRLGAVKIFADGALGARTAQMIEPYEGEPHNYGIAVATPEHLHAQVEKAARAGLAVHIHAIGDLANRHVLDAIAATRRAGIGLHLRHRIEHAQVLHPDDLPRFAQLNVIASMQPIHCTQDMILADAHWGKARSAFAYAWRALLDSGARIAFGSDAPVEDLDVLRGIHAAVTRRRADGSPGPEGWIPEQRITIHEAVHAYTTGAAYAAGQEKVQGQIAPGMVADLVVLSEDIFAIPPMALLETEVLATVVDGDFVYTHPDF